MATTDTWNWNEDSRVIIAPDEMSAAVFVSNPRPGETYTEESIIAILNHYGVTHGIDTSVIEEILQGGMYCKMITVAHGREAKDGCDGYYEFLFATEFQHLGVASEHLRLALLHGERSCEWRKRQK